MNMQLPQLVSSKSENKSSQINATFLDFVSGTEAAEISILVLVDSII
jgi:hypothetical protein